MLRNEALKLV